MTSLDVAVRALQAVPRTLSPSTFHRRSLAALVRVGFHVQREVAIPYSVRRAGGPRRGDVMRRIGKLDIVARAEGLSIAIECDRVTPRRKSLAKLRAFPGARVLVLREGLTGPAPEGIDALIGNYDEQYEPEEVCQVAGCGLAAGPEGVCCHCLEDLSGTEPSPTQPRRDDAAEQCDEATVGGRPR